MSKISKLGLSIVTFDGTELLESLISEIREYIDVVVISYQSISYCGNDIDDEDLNEIKRLKDIGLVDYIINFLPDITKDNREEETRKRNESIDFLEGIGCSHVLNIDSDEFYNKNEFLAAKEFINKSNCAVTYCKYINYYKDFEHVLEYPFEAYVPFISESKYRFKYKHWHLYGAADLTRRYYITNKPILDNDKTLNISNIIKMHHASWIRKDISKKLNNWSAKSFFSDEIIQNAISCYENFNENTKMAKMLFFSDNNELPIIKVNRTCNVKIKV